jgi:mono/diheme cytochrome c family protein
MSVRHAGRWLLLATVGVVALLAVAVLALNLRGEGDLDAEIAAASATASTVAIDTSAERIAHGKYLARVGNCMTCHSDRGGAAYAGGRGIDTPFGTVYSSNLTPDAATGLGRWSAAQFWRAMHHGRSADGRLLTPAFPYPNLTQVSRADSDALFAYLRSLPPVARAHQANTLRFPFNTQAALAVWRALYFTPGTFQAEATQSAEWNRGAYLVQGLAHCNACHAQRNALGATAGPLDMGGGLIPLQNWYAPSLADAREAGVADWSTGDITTLLKTGMVNRPGGMVLTSGPMGEVVRNSTQHLSDADLVAIATYLKTLGAGQVFNAAHSAASVAGQPASAGADAAGLPVSHGATLYADHCLACHGSRGEGVAGAYPPLAGNRAVTMAVSANLVRTVMEGGFAPATAGHPRPYGMPPYAQTLSTSEVAELLTHLRSSWGNQADAVTAVDVDRYRASGGR